MKQRDLGLFGPESVTWRVHAEPILMLAGLRALFLQALHPRAIAGVVRNSGYKRDPWGRLLRTVNYVAIVVYGTTDEAEAAAMRVRVIHARLCVDEPDLLLWVHVTEVESFLDTARRSGVTLTDAEADTYYAEQRRSAALVGLDPDQAPGRRAEIDDYYRRVRPELAMTRDAAETLLFLTVPPCHGFYRRPGWPMRQSRAPRSRSCRRGRAGSMARPDCPRPTCRQR